MATPSSPFPCHPPYNSTLRLYRLETQCMPTQPLPIDTFGYDPEDPQLFVRISKRFVYKKQTGSGPPQLYDSSTSPNVDQLALYGDPLAKTSKLVYTGPDDKCVPLLNPGEVPFATIATTGLVIEPPAKEHPIRMPPTPPGTPEVAWEVMGEEAADQIWEMGRVTKRPFKRKPTPYPDQFIDSGSEEAELVYPESRSSQTAPDPRKECTPHPFPPRPFPPRPRTIDCGEPSELVPRPPFRRECTPYPHPYPRPFPQHPRPTESHTGLVHRPRTRTRHTTTNSRPRFPPFNGERPPFVFPPRPIDHGEPGPSGSDARMQTVAAQPTPVLDSDREQTPYDQDDALALTYPYPNPEQHRPTESFSCPEDTELGLLYTYYSVGHSERQGKPTPTSVAVALAAAAEQIDTPGVLPPIIIVIPAKAPRSMPLPAMRTQQVVDCVYRLVELLGSGDGDHDSKYDPEGIYGYLDGHDDAGVGVAASSNAQQGGKERGTQMRAQGSKGRRKRSEDEDHDPLEHEREAEVRALRLAPFSELLLGQTQMQMQMETGGRPQCACCALPDRSDADRLRKRARIEDWLSTT